MGNAATTMITSASIGIVHKDVHTIRMNWKELRSFVIAVGRVHTNVQITNGISHKSKWWSLWVHNVLWFMGNISIAIHSWAVHYRKDVFLHFACWWYCCLISSEQWLRARLKEWILLRSRIVPYAKEQQPQDLVARQLHQSKPEEQ